MSKAEAQWWWGHNVVFRKLWLVSLLTDDILGVDVPGFQQTPLLKVLIGVNMQPCLFPDMVMAQLHVPAGQRGSGSHISRFFCTLSANGLVIFPSSRCTFLRVTKWERVHHSISLVQRRPVFPVHLIEFARK